MANELPVLTVTQINNQIKDLLQMTFRSICVEGEISGITFQSSGHIYLTLKDEACQISACMWRSSTGSLSFRPKTGDKVRCFGYISAYPQRGNYQLIINRMEMAGIGDVLVMLEMRKQKLAQEGLFAPEHKRPLPFFPKTIGVVTSPTGAAFRDICQTAMGRNPHIQIILFPAMVQGEGAAETICKMIEIANFYKMCDVLIVGRGGGSQEDLLPFSEESVVRSVYNSAIPVISAVGHEIDWSLADFAADSRAATPTQAAEIAVPVYGELIQRIQWYKNDLYNTISKEVQNKLLMVRSFKPENLEMQFRNIEAPYLMRFENAKRELPENLQNKIKDLKQQINQNITILEGASPATILNRGYSMVRDKLTGDIIRDAAVVMPGMELEITPSRGSFIATAK
ncbi:MAG: exodeoxyribonuclease VII large subunit [Treponema sp.]|nr:exodeoxyribonuclease VII large subunit [Treponema sp.]